MPGLAAVLALTLALANVAQTPSADAATEAHRQYLRGVEYEARRDLDQAVRSYQEALRLDPHLAAAHDRLGFVYGLSGRTADALAEFERARTIDPAFFDAQYHLGATLWWTGDGERALEALN